MDFPRLQVVKTDNKYHNGALDRWLRVHQRPYRIWVSRPSGERRFVPLRSRWVVGRTFAWLGRYRRLSKDYEHTPELPFRHDPLDDRVRGRRDAPVVLGASFRCDNARFVGQARFWGSAAGFMEQ
jgi:hypothetical protein